MDAIPTLLGPAALGVYQKAKAIWAAEENLREAKSGEIPHYLTPYKSKAAFIRGCKEALRLAQEKTAVPEIWNAVMEATYKGEPVNDELVCFLSDEDKILSAGPCGEPAAILDSPRKQLVTNLKDKGYKLQCNVWSK